MKTYIIGLYKNTVVFVHDYKTKEDRDKTFDTLTEKMNNPDKIMWMCWYGMWVDNIQKWDY